MWWTVNITNIWAVYTIKGYVYIKQMLCFEVAYLWFILPFDNKWKQTIKKMYLHTDSRNKWVLAGI